MLAWMLAALAVLHMGTTFRLAAATAFTKVWFFGAGVAMAQTALLNLLHRAYGRTALAWVTRASNAVMLGLAAVGGLVTGASAAELVVIARCTRSSPRLVIRLRRYPHRLTQTPQ